ncbi:MAG: leucine-rich repeat domain-containing protein, partial [Lachnospiraceae bacterium]|nr:leucine-rich repeat domain-containing protein [Lachnospiraceae bacterium]
MELRTEAFVLKYDEKEKSIVGYEDMGSVLDISNETEIETIGKKAFLGCKSLKKVFLPESIESLSDWCFSKCNNLKSVKIDLPVKSGIFGRGVFEGCEHLKEISFKDAHKDLSVLLAANVNRLPNEHLLRSEDLGQQGWYEKWDIALMALLNTDDAEGSINTLVCGEEDISTDGIGSVDGEMPGETDDFVKRAAKNKCFLCFLRLMHDSFLKEDK